MKKRVTLVVAVAGAWLLLALTGYGIACAGAYLLGPHVALIVSSIVAAVALAMLLGQYLAGTSDYFISIDNPRPLDDHDRVITSTAWGFASEIDRTVKAEVAGEGFADLRFSATRPQVAKSLFTFGFKRSICVVWRGNAGQHPMGDA